MIVLATVAPVKMAKAATDEPWGHYTKWNKPGTKRQILYWFHLHELCKAVKLTERESGRENGELFNGQSFSLPRWKNSGDLWSEM